MNCECIKLNGITKKFGDHTVLDNISLEINKGEVCGILGENGAGKSTLMKILAGIYPADSGEIIINGEKVNINSSIKAQKYGISMIFQDCQLIKHLTVSQNIFLKNELYYKYIPIMNKSLMDKKAKEILDLLKCNINVKALAKDLGYAQKQMVEIAKALILNARIIILDEPTSALLDSEVQNLFSIIKKLKELNVSIVYISHKLEEVRKIADKIVVMRDGQIVDTDEENNNSSDYYIRKMAGKDYLNRYPKIKCRSKDIVFRTENLSNTKRTVKNVNIKLHKGEIVGIAGLQGSGKTSIAEMIFGIEKKNSGKFYLDEKEINISHPWKAREKGIAYISEYVSQNIFAHQDVAFNFTISNLGSFTNSFIVNNKKISKTSKNLIEKLYFKIPFTKRPIKNLSQGIKQKLALSKLVYSSSKIIIMDEPTKDLDIPSKVSLYNIISQLSRRGVSILLISSDTEELIGMCNRIYIMCNGSIVKEIDTAFASSEKILYYASGERD